MENTLTNNEDIQSVVPSAEDKPAKNVNKLFNIVSLAYAGVLLAAEIFLLISMYVGIIAVNGLTFNSSEITYFVTLLIQRKFAKGATTFICLAIFSVFWLMVLITIIVGTIKALIGFFKFIKLGEEYESRELRFSKYVRTVSRSYGNAIALIVGSLAVNPSFTGMGSGVVALGCIIYILSSAIVIVFKDVLNKDKKFNLFELLINIAKKLVMFMLAFLLVANVQEGFNKALDFVINFELSESFRDVKLVLASIYFNMAKPMYMFCLPYVCVVAIITDTVKYYPLNNAKKDVNIALKKSFITLLVFTLLFCISDCVVYVMAYGVNAGDIANLIAESWLAFLFVSIAGILLTHSAKTQNEQIRG